MKFSEEHRKNLSKANKGKKPWIYGKKQTEQHIRNRLASRQKGVGYSTVAKGENHYRWKEDRTALEEMHRLRNTTEYTLWREAVFRRDNFTCVFCGAHGVELNADHIKPFAHYPELRFAIDNGRTLCVPCHKTTDTYGGRARRK